MGLDLGLRSSKEAKQPHNKAELAPHSRWNDKSEQWKKRYFIGEKVVYYELKEFLQVETHTNTHKHHQHTGIIMEINGSS